MASLFYKSLKYFLFTLLFMPGVFFAQTQLFIFNPGLVNDSIMSQSGLLSLHADLSDQMLLLGKEAIQVFQRNAQFAQRRIEGGCMSLAQERALRDRVLADQNRILSFEDYYIDTLALLKNRFEENATKIIHSIIKEINPIQSNVIAVDQSLIVYSDDSYTLNEQILGLFKKRLSDLAFIRRLDLAKLKVMEDLKIEQHLKFSIEPMSR